MSLFQALTATSSGCSTEIDSESISSDCNTFFLSNPCPRFHALPEFSEFLNALDGPSPEITVNVGVPSNSDCVDLADPFIS